MSNRNYVALSAIIAAAGGLIVVTSFAFNEAAATWIAFELSVIALTGSVVSLAAVPSSGASRYRAVAAVIGGARHVHDHHQRRCVQRRRAALDRVRRRRRRSHAHRHRR